jgi:hypothetical protein
LRHLPAAGILKSATRSFHWEMFAFSIDDGLKRVLDITAGYSSIEDIFPTIRQT